MADNQSENEIIELTEEEALTPLNRQEEASDRIAREEIFGRARRRKG